ncbi:MAG: hypothetical protein Q4B17_02565 [Lautropia sp.]|nr:hypothetical protein [Lautropia sp.]
MIGAFLTVIAVVLLGLVLEPLMGFLLALALMFVGLGIASGLAVMFTIVFIDRDLIERPPPPPTVEALAGFTETMDAYETARQELRERFEPHRDEIVQYVDARLSAGDYREAWRVSHEFIDLGDIRLQSSGLMARKKLENLQQSPEAENRDRPSIRR